MHYLEDFVPERFDSYSSRKKVELINKLANNIFERLNVNPIPVRVHSTSKFSNLCGKFMYTPPCIYINSFFIDKNKIGNIFGNTTDAERIIPYNLVKSVAHECYHYYQYCLVNKLVNNEELSEEEKDLAYLYFVSLYEKIFTSFCKKNELCPIDDELSEDDLYKYSPAEMDANDYADSIIEELAKVDNCEENYAYYSTLMSFEALVNKLASRTEHINSVKEKVIDYSLKVALAFLNYKNANSGLKAKYLNIDEKELKAALHRIKKQYQKKDDKIDKLLKKLSKK